MFDEEESPEYAENQEGDDLENRADAADEAEWKEQLIQEVQKYPVLWDKKSMAYGKTKQDIKDLRWKRLAETLGKEVPDCKKTWAYLSDYYGRQLKKHLKKPPRKPTGTGKEDGLAAKQWISRWQYFELMDFMRPVKESRPTSSNMPKGTQPAESAPESVDLMTDEDAIRIQRELQEYMDNSAVVTPPKTSKKRSEHAVVSEGSDSVTDGPASALVQYMDRVGGQLEGKTEDTEIDKFVNLMGASIKKLQPRNQLLIQKQISDLVHEYKLTEMDLGEQNG